ncbi:MAG: 13E12 repeat family protein, partial [Pseudonocardia sp.]|nr:13E12 repeat family protein [Pseudonocardia sp.]
MFEELSVREVETELVGMAGHLAAGTCRFLQLLAEFDTRDGWAGPGLRSCAHWLGWRVGMDSRTARDHLRVAHALARLPATTAAFATGRISYSKARALTRIATAGTEEVLLNVALHGTAAQLDELVRAARAGADPRPAAARRGLWSAPLFSDHDPIGSGPE